MQPRQRSESRPARHGVTPELDISRRVTNLRGLQQHRPYILIKDGHRHEVVTMSEHFLATSKIPGQGTLWYIDTVDTEGGHHRLILHMYGIVERPEGGMDRNSDFILIPSDREVTAQEIQRATRSQWYHTREYKMEIAGKIAELLLECPGVREVALYGSLARGENGADWDMIIFVDPEIAEMNLARSERGGPTCIISEYSLNRLLLDLLNLSEKQQRRLERLINAGLSTTELARANGAEHDRCLKFDLQVLPVPMSPDFRQRFLLRSWPGAPRGYHHDFLTTIERDLVTYNPSAGEFVR
jgi:hypothetical protein